MVILEKSQINKLMNFELLGKINDYQELSNKSKKRTRADKELLNSNDNPAKRKKKK